MGHHAAIPPSPAVVVQPDAWSQAGSGPQIPPVQIWQEPQARPSATGAFRQPLAASQMSWVHSFPSKQFAALGSNAHPVPGSQESCVQSIESAHSIGVPGMQVLFMQTSVPLHTLLSAQEVPSGTGRQAPSQSGSAQLSHRPGQRDWQQTPVAQNPDRHSSSRSQRTPMDLPEKLWMKLSNSSTMVLQLNSRQSRSP